MKVVLLGLEFAIENMGCQALAYSFANLLEGKAKQLEIGTSYTAVVYREFSEIRILDGKKIDCLKIRIKNLKFWHDLQKLFKESDLIVDFTGGDSFSDIYGIKRFGIGTAIKMLALNSKTPVMLGPQTYGPYNSRLCRFIAGRVIKKSNWVFARDKVSMQYAENISNSQVKLSTDVAFSLPYEKCPLEETRKKRVGINVSGLLWNGGYDHAPIKMSVDYQRYCHELLEYLCGNNKYEVYLVPHVGVYSDGGNENDYNACAILKKKYPEVEIIEGIKTPMDAKNFISAMDVFVGARMHATIAAFSSGVATIPFSYSRKFEGLYGNLGYDYIISALTDDTEKAVNNTISWIDDCDRLKEAVNKSFDEIKKLQKSFSDDLEKIITCICEK